MSNKNKMNDKLTLTAIFVKDINGIYSAFFAQLPNIMAQGSSQEEATTKLFNLVQDVFEHQRQKEIEAAKISGMGTVETKNFELSF